ncbi:DUF4190 domain-containing protein [Microbacterium sp. P01]|uniref:DUF4190 domain-containing protein n=1 Tax=unclassified Microbacterium TaxID=2609290 RepID=UPI00366D74DC
MSDTNSDHTGPEVPRPATPPAYDAPAAPPYATPEYGGASGYSPAPGYATAPPAYGAAGYPAPPAYGGYPAPAKTNSLAIVSLVSAIAGMVFIPFIGSIVAVITGHISLKQLRTSGEQGKGLGTAGLIVGYVGLALSILGVILFFLFIGVVASQSRGY